MPDSLHSRAPTQEMMLLDLVQRLDKLRDGRIGVHLHLSRLSRAFGRERYVRIGVESFVGYVSGLQGQLFPLENGDLFFMAKDAPQTALEGPVSRLQQLFAQDPLFQQAPLEGGPDSSFCTWYDLTKDYDKLLKTAQELLHEAEKKREEKSKIPYYLQKEIEPIGPDLLSRLESSLETADVTVLTRRQTVCTIIDEARPQPLFEEIFVSIEDLQRVVTPGVDLSADVWLFRYLTYALDRRIMQMLVRDGVSTARPFSLNLNVATILSPEFTKFESAITPQLRGRLVIEMNKLDVFSDMGAFLFARDYLRDHGFRLCLDGLTHHTLRYYNRSNLGFDLIKLFWAPGAVEDMPPSMKPEIRNMVMDTGQAHTILCRCDNECAIQTGQELGIIMFQGREVDRLLAAPPPPPKTTYRV